MTLACVRAGFGDPPPKFSVVALLCDFGDEQYSEPAGKCIGALRNTVPSGAEIIFVVNRPSGKLSRWLVEATAVDERVIVVSLNRNLGVVAKNLGYEVAQGDYVFSVDGDVVVRETRAFEKCVAFLDANPRTAIVGPCGGRLVNEFWSPTAWGVTGAHEKKHICGYHDPVDFGSREELDGEVVDTIPSMFWCFRRNLLSEIGPLDWRYGPFVGSDSDFCFRAKEAGYEVRIVRVPITHLGGGAHSHRHQPDLEEVKYNHLKALYDTWHPKLNVIGEYYR